MAKSKIDFRHIFIEALLIVFTVSLALALSEWRNSVKEDRTKVDVLNNIVREIEANKADLEKKLGYHQKMSQKLNRYLESDSLWQTLKYTSGMEAMFQILDNGIWNPQFQEGAWRSAELSGVVNTFDYETIYVLSNMYRVQEEGPDTTWKKLAGVFADPDSYEPKSAKRLAKMLALGFGELYLQEKSLLYNYNKALEHLKNN